MSKACSSPYQPHRFQRSSSITSHFQAAAKPKQKHFSTNSCKSSAGKPKKGTMGGQREGKQKEQNKTSVSKGRTGREGLTMTSSLNIPQLSPANHSEFTRNSSLQFTTHLCEQPTLAQLLKRTQITLKQYEQTTQRLTTRNKQITRKLALANQQILQLERQLRKSKELM